MTWIIIDIVHVWKLIYVCYFFSISLILKKSVTQAAEFETW